MSIHPLKPSWSRKLVCGMLIVLLLSGIQSGCKRDDAGSQGVTMQLTPSKTEYRLNEEIVISVKLINRGDKPCRIVPDPEATVQVLSLSRNGIPRDADYTMRTHVEPFERFLRDKLVEIEPHAFRSLLWEGVLGTSTGTGIVLLSVPRHTQNTNIIARWPVDEVGAYSLTATYVFPAFVHVPSDACHAGVDPVTTTFAVTPK